MTSSVLRKPKGILHPKAGEKNFRLMRYAPSTELAFYVEHYWSVHWDLRGKPPFTAETLPYPSVHIVFENDTANVYGVMTNRFTRQLEGKNKGFAIKFKPGAFRSFAGRPVSELTDSITKLPNYFGKAGSALQEGILATEDDEDCLELAEAFLLKHIPNKSDDNITLVDSIVTRVTGDRDITKVDDLVNKCQLSKRSLQRLFSDYVGVSPKWVIRRCRLHEATDRLAEGRPVDWAALAVDLGYFDQAHFIKDFKKLVGASPAEYVKQVR